MNVLKATEEQKNKIQNLTKKPFLIRFFLDYNGDFVTSANVLNDPEHKEIINELSKLEIIEYIPILTIK